MPIHVWVNKKRRVSIYHNGECFVEEKEKAIGWFQAEWTVDDTEAMQKARNAFFACLENLNMAVTV